MEQRLIDANAAIQFARENINSTSFVETFMAGFLAECPTIDPVHAAGACYCGECIKRNTPDCAMWYQCSICGGQWSWESDNVFCSFGERRKHTDDY